MRIIAGLAKGKKLLSPIGMDTRPTLDRVKQSIFNIIQGYIPDAIVLDVFAGTGSLGLEAASRGAKQCYLIDKGEQTYGLLRKNIETLEFQDICKSYNTDAYSALEMFGEKGIVFDLIFIDPPYRRDMIPPAVEMIHKYKLLHREGLIVVKIDSSEIIYEGNESILRIDTRKYGNTTVCFYRYKED